LDNIFCLKRFGHPVADDIFALGTKRIGENRYEQGTTKYYADTTEQMAKKEAKPGDSSEEIAEIRAERDAARAIIRAAKHENVKYLHVESLLSNTPTTLKNVQMREFKIDPRAVLQEAG
jgi:hypothetical protein